MSADRMTELLSWGILTAGMVLLAVMLYTAHARFEATWQNYQQQVLPISPK